VKEQEYDTMDELMTRVLTGEATPEQEAQLSSWLTASAENAQRFDSFKKVFDLSNTHYRSAPKPLDIDLDHEWDKFHNRIKMKTIQPEAKPSTHWLKMAAAILALVVSGMVINYFLYKNDVQYNTTSSILTIQLPDSSTVVLNRSSSLLHKPSFGEESRIVELDGEAYFNVMADTARPFIIETSKGNVEVVGTSFSISSYDSLEAVEVTVESGIVSFHVPDVKQTIRLKAGEKAVYQKSKNELSTTTYGDPNEFAWGTRRIVFQEATLAEVVTTINKTYNVNMTLETPVSESCVVTVSFENQDLDSVLRVLETTLNITISRNGADITLNSDGC
jgi:transmembrane sensor